MLSQPAARSYDAEVAPCRLEGVQRELQFLAAVRSRHDGAYARLALRDGRESDALRKNAFFKQAVRQGHRTRPLPHDHGRNRALAGARIESQRLEAALEEPGVLPQPLDELRFLLEDLDRGQARG